MTAGMLAFLLVALACGPADPLGALEACPDQACRTAALLPAWQADPDGTRAWLLALEDPTVQATLIEGLAMEHSGDAAALCRALPEGAHARVRCERRVVRPHLEGGGKPQQAQRPQADLPPPASGPRTTTLGAPEQGPPPWEDAEPPLTAAALEGCDAGEPALCGRIVARQHAEAGRWEPAGVACLAGDPERGKGYSECLFQAAEVLAEEHGAGGLGDALRLCGWSSFEPMCVAHSLTLVGPPVPGADAMDEATIAATLEVVRAIEAAASEDPRHREVLLGRYWSSWTWSTVSRARRVDGRLVSLLPAEAQPHLPVAMAARLLRGLNPATIELDAVVAELEAALADPGVAPGARPGAAPQALVTNHNLQSWAADRRNERDIPATWVMGPGRRAVADDPAAELRIAVLEAAAQLREPPPAAFFLAVVSNPAQHRLVRWTGARIGGLLDPSAAAQLTDPDPLVQAALDHPRKKGGGKRKPKP